MSYIFVKKIRFWEKSSDFSRKYSVICDFQTLWESHNSQQLFLSSKSRVKWRGMIRKVFLMRACRAGEIEFLLFITNRSLVPEQILFDCWADVFFVGLKTKRATSRTNVFVKPNAQNRACSSYAMARKRRMKSNEKQDANKKMNDDRKLSSP